MSIHRIYRLQAAEDKADELNTFLAELMVDICAAPGCESVEIFRSPDEPDQFIVMERWDSRESHTRSAEHFPKEKMKAAMPLFNGPPDGGFYQQQSVSQSAPESA